MSLAKDMIEAQREAVAKSGGFTCAGCSKGLLAPMLGAIRVYQPEGGDPEPAVNAIGKPNLGVFMLCNICAHEPWSKIRMGVVKVLAKAGLFNVKSANR